MVRKIPLLGIAREAVDFLVPFFFLPSHHTTHPFQFLCKFLSRFPVHRPMGIKVFNFSSSHSSVSVSIFVVIVTEINFVNADYFLGFNEAFSWQCPEIHEGEQIRELLWPQDRHWRQHEHLPVPCEYYPRGHVA